MVEIKNRKFQPLTLHLANSKRSVHLLPRGKTEVADTEVSDEMRRAAERGFIALRRVPSKPKMAHPPKPKPLARPKAPDVPTSQDKE